MRRNDGAMLNQECLDVCTSSQVWRLNTLGHSETTLDADSMFVIVRPYNVMIKHRYKIK